MCVILWFLPYFYLCASLTDRQSGSIDMPDAEVLIVEPLAGHYSSADTLYLPLVNISDSLLYYSLSLEINNGAEWEALISDVFRSSSDKYKAQNIKLVPAGEITVIPLVLSDLLPDTGLTDYDKKFRFCILAKKSPFDKGGKEYYSTIFFLANKEI